MASKVHDDNAKNAEYTLGMMDYYGKGGPRDRVSARKWFLEAAQQGEVSSEYNIGRMMVYGEGGPVDYAGARGWFLRAAGHGSSEAKYNIGVMYQNGMGTRVDYVEARRWFAAAAAQGNADARRALAVGNRRMSPSSHEPSWLTCHTVLSGHPFIAGMAGCAPW